MLPFKVINTWMHQSNNNMLLFCILSILTCDADNIIIKGLLATAEPYESFTNIVMHNNALTLKSEVFRFNSYSVQSAFILKGSGKSVQDKLDK